MTIKNMGKMAQKPSGDGIPFVSVEEAWFWFVQANAARQAGARIVKGIGCQQRPCEPVDILTVLERLYRARRLMMDHIRVLHFYGVRMVAPDPCREREAQAHKICSEALERLEDVLIAKGIVKKPLLATPWTKNYA